MFLISDIIQYSSNDNKNMKIIKENVGLRKIIYFNYEILKALISCNEQKLRLVNPVIEFDSCLQEAFIDTDEFRLNQIILNIISNAVKFTKAGKIIIRAKLKINIINKSESIIIISIQDTGIGIKKDQKTFIFSESENLNLNYDMNKMGSGLGLSICKSIAEMLGYKINFESEEKCGTIFSIEIPFTLSSSINSGKLSNLSILGNTQMRINSNDNEFSKELLNSKDKDKKSYYNQINTNSKRDKDNIFNSSKLFNDESVNSSGKFNKDNETSFIKFKTSNEISDNNKKQCLVNVENGQQKILNRINQIKYTFANDNGKIINKKTKN